MSKEDLLEAIEGVDPLKENFSVEKDLNSIFDYLKVIGLPKEQSELLGGMLLVLAASLALKTQSLKTLKSSSVNSDLSSSILVDIDTRYELLFSHAQVLISDINDSEFDFKLRSGARLSEEFFSDLIYGASKLQRTISSELNITDLGLQHIIRNLNSMNNYLSAFYGSLSNRYDGLYQSLISNS
jgi:hypothetical protein